MRIIAGEFRGRNLISVPDKSVRPAMDRVKATIFNMLQNRLRLVDAQVLDLFAGTGNLGFEALSRGAARVTFVENGDEPLDTIEKNAAKLGCEDRCSILHDDALRFISRASGSFDLIFADPPYRFEALPDLPALIMKSGLLNKDGFLIIEHSKYTDYATTADYVLSVQKEFGTTRVSFFTYPPRESDS